MPEEGGVVAPPVVPPEGLPGEAPLLPEVPVLSEGLPGVLPGAVPAVDPGLLVPPPAVSGGGEVLEVPEVVG